ncbi:hypothetical protein AGLY_011258 [Aphis glycines]|uniref:Uncharacterized protein n=1 Tax=Aphis glycines TaxID=307491 RepID=A0A6G0TCX9_APHGL|nr:hypothetical protein AGLY_011258 [Aphis glycines]
MEQYKLSSSNKNFEIKTGYHKAQSFIGVRKKNQLQIRHYSTISVYTLVHGNRVVHNLIKGDIIDLRSNEMSHQDFQLENVIEFWSALTSVICIQEHDRAATGLVLFLNTDDISHTSNVNNTYFWDKGTNTKIWNFNPKENGIVLSADLNGGEKKNKTVKRLRPLSSIHPSIRWCIIFILPFQYILNVYMFKVNMEKICLILYDINSHFKISDECIDFTMMGGFRLKSEYSWSITEVKSKKFLIVGNSCSGSNRYYCGTVRSFNPLKSCYEKIVLRNALIGQGTGLTKVRIFKKKHMQARWERREKIKYHIDYGIEDVYTAIRSKFYAILLLKL